MDERADALLSASGFIVGPDRRDVEVGHVTLGRAVHRIGLPIDLNGHPAYATGALALEYARIRRQGPVGEVRLADCGFAMTRASAPFRAGLVGRSLGESPRMAGMADKNDRADADIADITDLILDEHEEFRRQFVELWDLRASGDPGAISATWQPLADLLEVHATAEEEIFYPVLLKRGGDEAPEETDDAVGDHNEIRDAIRAASELETGSDPWWQAVLECRKANDEHLAEEERDVIPDFREHTDEALRSRLGADWVAFHARHRGAHGISGEDIDPQEYIVENS